MHDLILQEINELYQDRAFLTVEEVAILLSCPQDTIYNWTKRANPKKRPPRIIVGKSIRFPKQRFARWLADEQGTEGSL